MPTTSAWRGSCSWESAACLKALRPGDTLVVWKLDRLGRNLQHLVSTVNDLNKRGIGFKVLTGHGANIDTTTANGKLVFGFFASLAEFERELIVERTKAGMAAARARGRHGGRPYKMTAAKLRLAMASMGESPKPRSASSARNWASPARRSTGMSRRTEPCGRMDGNFWGAITTPAPTSLQEHSRMDNLLTVAFEAHNAEKNHHRRYQVTVGRDLLDDWTVAIRYGRTGQSGRELRYASSQPEQIRSVIRDRLRRRLSAPKRIGCAYRLASFHAAPGFDTTTWLPTDIMARFFQAT